VSCYLYLLSGTSTIAIYELALDEEDNEPQLFWTYVLSALDMALDTLSQAVRLAEPEGCIRCFVDEGAPMDTLLSQLREKQRLSGPTPYLDTMLAAFSQQSQTHEQQLKRARPRTRRSLPHRDDHLGSDASQD